MGTKKEPEVLVVKKRPGFHTKGNVAAIEERLALLGMRRKTDTLATGCITVADVIEDARDESSPLHRELTWDDSRAAQLRREDEARHLIVSFEFRWVDDGGIEHAITPAYVCVTEPGSGERVYVKAPSIRDNGELWSEVITEAIAGVKSWQNRLLGLKQLDTRTMKAFADLTARLEAEATKAKTGQRKRKTG